MIRLKEAYRPAHSAKCGHITGHSHLNPAVCWTTYTILAIGGARPRLAGRHAAPLNTPQVPQPTHLRPGVAGSPSPVLPSAVRFLSNT